MKAEQLGKKIDRDTLSGSHRVVPAFREDTNAVIDAYLTSAEINGMLKQIFQACNQWLEEQGAQHKVRCPHCSWSQFTSEVAGMSQCYECNSTGYTFEPLRLEIDA